MTDRLKSKSRWGTVSRPPAERTHGDIPYTLETDTQEFDDVLGASTPVFVVDDERPLGQGAASVRPREGGDPDSGDP